MIRKDLRSSHETRQISVNLGGVMEVDGAAQFSQGNTSVLATVTGPAQPKYSRHEHHEKCKIEVDVNMATEESITANEKVLAEFLKRALNACVLLTAFPRLLIAVKVLVTRNDGSVLSTALNACMMACLDAGIPMKTFATCVELTLLQREVLLDPTSEEEQESTGNITVVVASKSGESGVDVQQDDIIAMEVQGSVSRADLNTALLNASKYSAALTATMREGIANKLASSNVSVFRS